MREADRLPLNAAIAIASVAVFLATSTGCSRASRETAPAAAVTAAVTLGIPGAENTGAGIAASGRHVVVVWAASLHDQMDVYSATSDDGGVTFRAPVRVNNIAGDARISGDQAPRVALGAEVVVAWESKLTGESRIRVARSRDGGRTFLPAETAHDPSLPGARGWASVALGAGGAVDVAWLDGRNAQHDMSHTSSATAGAPHTMEQDLFHLTWRPDGTRIETRVARNVCFCCKTSLATTADGATYVAWRHIYPTNVRDIAVARSTDGGRTWSDPVRVSEDHWQIAACPEDGPSIVAAEGVLHVAWPTMVDADRKAVFYADSTDGGRTFSPRVRVDLDDADVRAAGHVQLALADGGVVAAWDETTVAGRRIMLRAFAPEAGGAWAPRAPTIVSADDTPASPAVAASGHGLVVAWTAKSAAGSTIHVQRFAGGA